MGEEWRPIPNADGYEASSEGRIRSWRLGGGARWPDYRRHEPKILRPQTNPNGYAQVSVNTNGVQRRRTVHRLVALAFHGLGDGLEVRHLNGDQQDNRAENLRWGTSSENRDDARRHGTLPNGDRNGLRLHPDRVQRGSLAGSAKLTEENIPAIRRDLAAGRSQTAIAGDYGVCRETISQIGRGLTWRHVLENA